MAAIERLPTARLQLLQATGHIGSGGTELLAEGGIETFDLLSHNLRISIGLRGGRDAPQQDSRNPKQDKGSQQHDNKK